MERNSGMKEKLGYWVLEIFETERIRGELRKGEQFESAKLLIAVPGVQFIGRGLILIHDLYGTQFLVVV